MVQQVKDLAVPLKWVAAVVQVLIPGPGTSYVAVTGKKKIVLKFDNNIDISFKFKFC